MIDVAREIMMGPPRAREIRVRKQARGQRLIVQLIPPNGSSGRYRARQGWLARA